MQESFQQKGKNVQESLAMQLVSGEAVGMAAMVLRFEIIERRISKLEALGSGYVRLKNYLHFISFELSSGLRGTGIAGFYLQHRDHSLSMQILLFPICI